MKQVSESKLTTEGVKMGAAVKAAGACGETHKFELGEHGVALVVACELWPNHQGQRWAARKFHECQVESNGGKIVFRWPV